MGYVIVDVRGADRFDELLLTDKANAIDKAASEWERLSEHDKSKRSEFYLMKVDDLDAYDFGDVDGDIVKRWK